MTSGAARALLLAAVFPAVTACGAAPDAPPGDLAAPTATAPAASARPLPEAVPTGAPTAGATAAPPPEPAVDEQGCVRNPTAHGVDFILQHHAQMVAERLGRAPERADFAAPQGCLSKSSLPDLDKDGAEETVVAEGCSWGTHGALHLLYFSNKGCPRFAGDLVSGELSPLETEGAGVRDLESTWSSGCAGGDFEWTHHRWDGKAYRVIDKATCHLCTDADAPKRPPGANKHAHCKAEAKKRGVKLP